MANLVAQLRGIQIFLPTEDKEKRVPLFKFLKDSLNHRSRSNKSLKGTLNHVAFTELTEDQLLAALLSMTH
jgi:hypothetical protein